MFSVNLLKGKDKLCEVSLEANQDYYQQMPTSFTVI